MILRRHRHFARLWLGQVVSVSGDGMQRLALLWWAAQHGGAGLLVTVAACGIVPVVAVSPLGGWAADRYDRRRLLLAADLLRFATTAGLALVLLAGDAPVVAVGLLVALTGVGTAVFDPTYAAAVPTLVPAQDRAAANGLNLANSAAGGLLGPLLGGLLLGVLDVGWVLAVNAATFAWSAAFVRSARIPGPAGGVEAAAAGPATSGLRTVLADRGLRRLVGLAAVLNLVVAPVPLLIVSLAVDGFGVGAGAYGLLQALLSAGLLAGALSAGAVAGRRNAIAGSMAVLGAGLAALGLVPFAVAAVVLVVGGGAIAIANTALVTTFQQTVPAEVQGRVFGVIGAMAEGLRPLGLLLGAPLLGAAGVHGAFVAVGLLVLATTATWALPRRVPRPATPAAAALRPESASA